MPATEELTRSDYIRLAKNLHEVEFDHPWIIRDGEVVDGPGHAPSFYSFEQEDGTWSDEEADGEGWEPVSENFTGQYGYNGPVLHASETFGWGMAERFALLAAEGEYDSFATVVVECIGLDDELDSEPGGWMVVARRVKA